MFKKVALAIVLSGTATVASAKSAKCHRTLFDLFVGHKPETGDEATASDKHRKLIRHRPWLE